MLLDASSQSDLLILEPYLDTLLNMLFAQVSQPIDYRQQASVRNHNEVLRCFAVLGILNYLRLIITIQYICCFKSLRLIISTIPYVCYFLSVGPMRIKIIIGPVLFIYSFIYFLFYCENRT